MPEKLKITIVGLGLIGASAGLALRRYADRVTVIGHDRNPALAGRAKSLGAVERTEWNLINAVSKADRVILALPVSEMRDTLTAIAQDLKPGCVLLDMADVKTPVLRWAQELLPDNVHLVGGHPIVVVQDLDPSTARADLFQGKLFCLTSDGNTDDSAMRLAADLVEALGARPFFLDPVEHDGMAAAVEHLPVIMAGALMQITLTSPGWADMRKLAGSQFYTSTLVAASEGGAAIAACAANREHVVRWLGELIAELDEWRQRLTDGEQEALTKALDEGMTAGRKWLQAQMQGNWSEEVVSADMPDSGTYLRQLVGLGRMGKQPGKPKR
jgi:prephenate dehydrogenase